MNANELIELLDKNAGDGDTPVRQAVTLIRRLKAEIEALKEQLHWLVQEPAKTLTDEEIKQLADYYGICEVSVVVIDFANAILRKAQENG